MRRPLAQHLEWLNLVDYGGAFLTPPVLRRVFPQGLDRTPTELRSAVRDALEDLGGSEAERTAWLRFVLTDLLDLGPYLAEGPAIAGDLHLAVPEHGVTVRPDFVLMSAQSGTRQPRMLVCRWPFRTDFDRRPTHPSGGALDRWAASPIERAAALCRATGVPLALVTDTDRLTLVWAPRNAAAGWATWPSSLFAEERTLLDSFASLLGARRFFGVVGGDQLEALFRESAGAQAEVTDQLGTQVRAAVELLIGAVSRVDRARRGALLRGVSESEVYSAAVTVMMRLVFLLTAEERRLFPIDDELYLSSYAISSLRDQLQEEADRDGEEVLEHRQEAWHRVLATFRAVYGGIQHERLRLPAYGGSLFDPDRYPFLEGRSAATAWRDTAATPLPIDDRTMLAVLDALQVLTFRAGGVTEARRLSYRTLDIEQIGHVYEGLLDHGCVRARGTVLGLVGKKGEEPEIALDDLEAQRAKGETAFITWLKEQTGRTPNQLGRLLAAMPDLLDREHLMAACDNDDRIYQRVAPFAGLLRKDLRGLPTLFLGPATHEGERIPGALYVTQTSERRDSGTQYTTKELADEIVRYALEPIVYSPGPAEGAEPGDWVLKSSAELLKLKVCDPAVGSGAILVAACRYLAERLVEAWQLERLRGVGQAGLPPSHIPEEDLELLARRVITDHCLFGVDRNPMAAEMAKLSLWLTTMARERPFTFLDHAIHAGDSLLGITSLEQLQEFHLDPARGRQIHRQGHTRTQWDIQELLRQRRDLAVEYGRKLSSITVLSSRDAEEKRYWYNRLEEELSDLTAVGDLLIGAALATAGKGDRALDDILKRLMFEYLQPAYVDERSMAEFLARIEDVRTQAAYLLDAGRPPKAPERKPLHWPLAFPEVFLDPERTPGFDAMVGNPPFLGGQRITGRMGTDLRDFLVEHIADGRKGSADLVAYFYLRCAQLAHGIGMLATNTIAQGDTREVGLDWLLGEGAWTLHRAVKSRPWPGEASLEVAQLWLRHGNWTGERLLDDIPVTAITPSLDRPGRVQGNPYVLRANEGQSFQGSNVLGLGFTMSPAQAQTLIERNPQNTDVLFPYLNGEDLNDSPTQSASRWIINFFDWPFERAKQYRECIEIVRELVYSERQKPTVNVRSQQNWWRYERSRPELYAAVAPLRWVLVIARVSKTVQPAFVPTGIVFNEQTVVFAYDDDFHFGVLTSAFHWWWAITRASTMRTDIRYTPTDCFETFPQPDYSAAVEAAGKALDDHRRPLMIQNNEGLTKTYNRVHNPAEKSAGIVRLRELHRALDLAVRDAYGWQDQDLDHGFHETSQGVRYTIGPAARTELLDRLLELNHRRYAEEVAQGLHDKKRTKAGSRKKKGEPELSLFGAEE